MAADVNARERNWLTAAAQLNYPATYNDLQTLRSLWLDPKTARWLADMNNAEVKLRDVDSAGS